MTDYKALYEQTLKRLEDAEHEASEWEDSYNELKEKNYIRENEKLQKKMKKIKKDWAEEKESVKQEGRDEAISEYDKLAFVIGGHYEPNNPSLMINSVELMKHKYKKLEDENKKLTKSNRMLSASIKRTMEADWKNKFYALEEEATLESQALEAEIRALKPISKDTKRDYDAVLKAQTKELTELKKEIAGYEEYQKEVDDMENNLLDLLERHEVRDAEGHLYTTNDSEVRHYDVLGVVETLLTRLSQKPIVIYKSQE